MDIYSSIVLAIVQGITEFIPVSSSAHLVFVRKFLNLEYSHAFDVFLNIGTVLAILFYYKKETLQLACGLKDILNFNFSENTKFLLNLAISSLPTIVVFGIAEMFLGGQSDSMIILATCLILFSLVIYVCDKYSKSIKTNLPNLKEWFIVGVAQTMSLIPGISRLGVTSSAFRILEFSRVAAFKYAILLSVPAVCGACFLKLIKILTGTIPSPPLSYIFCGVFFSFIVGLLTLKIVNVFLEKHTYLAFAIYRVIFGLLIILIIYFNF